MNDGATDQSTPVDPATLPLYCDFSCPYARFAEQDSVGACRREVGVFCSVLKTYVNKHARCRVRKNSGTVQGR